MKEKTTNKRKTKKNKSSEDDALFWFHNALKVPKHEYFEHL